MNDSLETKSTESDSCEASTPLGRAPNRPLKAFTACLRVCLWVVIAVAGAATGYLLAGMSAGGSTPDDDLAAQALIVHRVARSDFAVTISQRGHV